MYMWGESTVIVEGREIRSIARYGEEALALTALSRDYGRTWTLMGPSNLPMATSKPYAGILSTGQRYLICTTTADSGEARMPLTIAVSPPGEPLFSRVFQIRERSHPGTNAIETTALAYPYAVEHEGNLYVVYSVNHLYGNINSAEMAVIPIPSLSVREN